MRRGPEENNQEQEQGRQGDGAANGEGADNGRGRSRDSADDDVEGRSTFQQHCINEDVEGYGGGKQHCRAPIQEQAHGKHGTCCKRTPEAERLAGEDPPLWNWAGLRACHDCVNVRVEPHVERARRACAKGDAEQRYPREQRMRR